MGKAPAVIVIARHGARLDAENSAWISASPTPYDPPLSYGGWTQTRALGARIASLLHARDVSLNGDDADEKRRGSETIGAKLPEESDHSRPEKKSRRRKRKIIIHSSPFLRCLQSSIAISAGLSQYEGNLLRFDTEEHQEPIKQPKLFSTPARSKTMDTTALERKYGSIKRPHSPKTHSHGAADTDAAFQKPLLRVDAFLGEWLTPNYYEHMTPPPPSSKMIAGAKAMLSSTATPIPGRQASSMKDPPGSKNHEKTAEAHAHVSFAMDALHEALDEDDAVSRTSSRPSSSKGSPALKPHNSNSPDIGYQPPTPNYAILTSDAIPDGYVAHARDACVATDSDWDSTKEPQLWGDGGNYGEEWSSMHKRFRSGLADMVVWYKEHDLLDGGDMEAANAEVDDDYDIVLVVVTHGAGCNALIGALTNQPVLLDVGMGSLTMAVRKENSLLSTPELPHPTSTFQRRHSSVEYSQSDEYVMKIVASTEHLRAGADPLQIPALQSPRTMPSIAEHGRTRGKSVSISTSGAPLTDLDRPRSKNSALGSIRRIRPTINPTYKPANQDEVTSPGSAGGLWGGRRSSVQENRRSSVQDNRRASVASVQEEIDSLSPAARTPTVDFVNNGFGGSGGSPVTDGVIDLPSQASLDRRGSQRGLWGGIAKEEPKRRWTVQEDK